MRKLFFVSIALLFTYQSFAQVEIKSEKDWDKVTITSVQADVNNLLKGEVIKAKTTGRTLTANRRVLKMKTLEELKRKAAAKGYNIVLIVNQNSRSFHRGGKHGVISTAVGIGYSYN